MALIIGVIDIDECGLSLSGSANRSYGKAGLCQRVREGGHGVKITLILAISCNGFVHVQLRRVPGTTGVMFTQFITGLINRLLPIAPGNAPKIFCGIISGAISILKLVI